MAQLKDLVVNGVSRLISDTFMNKAQISSISALDGASSTTYGIGTSGQFLRSNSTNIYWSSLNSSDLPQISITDGTTGTLTVPRGGTGNTTMTANRLVYCETANAKLSTTNHYSSNNKIAINNTTEPTETLYVNGNTKLAGAVETTGKITLSGTTSNTAVIEFSRTGASPYNYLTVPTSSQLAITVGDADGANTRLAISETSVNPTISSTYTIVSSLGISDIPWNGVYSGNLTLGGAKNTDSGKTLSSSSTLYLNSAANTNIVFQNNGIHQFTIDSSSNTFRPAKLADNSINTTATLGTNTYKWAEAYITKTHGHLDGIANAAYYGVCETAAGTATKTVNITDFNLTTGAHVYLKFTAQNSHAAPTLNINGTGAFEIQKNGARAIGAALTTNIIYELIYDGTCYQIINDITPRLGETNTEASKSPKVFTCPGFILYEGATVRIKFPAYNTHATPTININGTGAKSVIFADGTAVLAQSFCAGSIYTLVYDGTQYQVVNITALRYYQRGISAVADELYTQEEYDAYVTEHGEPPTWSVGDIKTSGTAATAGYDIIGVGNATTSTTTGGMTGRLRLYGAGTKYTDIIPAQTGSNGNYTFELPEASGYGIVLNKSPAITATIGEAEGWAVANWDAYDGFYLPLTKTNGGAHVTDVFKPRVRLYKAASSTGYSILDLGNGKATGTAGNAYGAIRLFSTGIYGVNLRSQNTITADRTCFLPAYDDSTYLAHTGNNNAVGGATTGPVYVAENGRITAITSVDIAHGGTNATTAAGARTNLGLGNSKIFYGTCSTAADTAIKQVVCEDFANTDLVTGALIFVTFTITNTAAVANLQLKVNTSDAKPIKIFAHGTTANLPEPGWLMTNQTYLFKYTGAQWVAEIFSNSLRTYSSSTNINVPLIGQSSSNSITTAWDTYTNTYKDWYGVIPNDDAKRAKINLSTGLLTVSSLTVNGTSTLKGIVGTDGLTYGTSFTGTPVNGQIFLDTSTGNDYAEYRISTEYQPGRCVIENGDDTLSISTQRMQPGAMIISDTYGDIIGWNKDAKTPIAIAGRVLAYPYEDREEFKKYIGHPVCSGPNGTVSIMTDEEYKNFGYCAIGYISSVPEYKKWGNNQVNVNKRIWIKV